MTDHRKGLPGERPHVAVDHDVHQGLSSDEQHEPRHRRLRERIVAISHYDGTSGKEAYIEDKDDQSANQTVFLHDETVHIVFEHDRNHVFLCAFSRTFAEETSFLYGDLSAYRLLYLVKRLLELDAVSGTFPYYVELCLYASEPYSVHRRLGMAEYFLAEGCQ